MDTMNQMKTIEKTLEDNQKSIKKHHSNPNAYVIETLNIFPDFKVNSHKKILNIIPTISFNLY